MKINKKLLFEFKNSSQGKQILKEFDNLRIHSGSDADVDDAIVAFHSNPEQYFNITKERAAALGMTVLNYLIGKNEFMIKKLDSRYAGDFTEDGNYFDDDGNVKYRDTDKLPQVTYFDRGVQGKNPGHGSVFHSELEGQPAYNKWKKRIIQVASLTGWTFIDWLDANQSVDDSLETKKNQDNTLPSRKLKHKAVNIQTENTQRIIEDFFIKRHKKILNEMSNTSIHSGSSKDVDDGVYVSLKNAKQFLDKNKINAEKLGMTILNNLFNPDKLGNQNFKSADFLTVTFFPKGIDGDNIGNGTAHYKELMGQEAYDAWLNKIKVANKIIGYEFIDFLNTEKLAIKDAKYNY